MEKDERLLPLPNVGNLQKPNQQDYPANYSPFYDDDTVEQKRSVVEYLNIVYKRLPIILAMTVITTAVVAFYMYRQPSIFEARTEMVIEPRKPKLPSTKDATYINLGNDANYYNTQLQLLHNPDLMRAVVIRLGLQREPNLFGTPNRSFLSTLRTMVSGEKENQSNASSLPVITATETDSTEPDQIVLTPEEKSRVDAYAGMLSGGLRVEKVEGTNLVNIFVTSTNPDLAAKVADKTAEVFIEQDIQRATEGSKKSLVDLTKSIEDLRTQINNQDQERINYLEKNNLLASPEKGSDLTAQRLTTLSTQWMTAIDERRRKQQDYDAAVAAAGKGQIMSVVGGTNNQALQDAQKLNQIREAELKKRLEDINNQINALKVERESLLSKYTPEYIEVKKVDAKIAALQESFTRIDKEDTEKNKAESEKLNKNAQEQVLTGLLAQLQAAQKREAQMQAAYLSEYRQANSNGVAETRLTTLTREIETNRTLYDTLIQKQKGLELEVTSSKPDNLTISNRAQKPGGPIGPNRSRNILIAFLISLSAGIGLAFLLDYLDDSVRTSDDIGRYLGLPTLALIPHQSSGDKRKLNIAAGKSGDSNSSLALVSLRDNRSAIAEAYRHLRTSLLFSSAGKPPQTILVTSSQPSEGKTTTAINTAITLAQAGADVVIIDCDLRRPRLHSHFGLENGNGLTNYLSGEKNTDNLLKPYAGLPKLKVITSGPIPPNPAELLSSGEMKNLLQFLKGNYKHVIIDSPPAISFTDAAILSTLVDGVILVAMAGKSSMHLIRRFKQRLGTIGARIYGVVLNGVRLNSVEYNYYGYGYTSDYYANHDDSTPLMEDVVSVEDAK
ncbi:MAG: polysaccharide biosynthesis tyrosine autokinase [Acidobacteriota bacterium]|nr:polysaccharide biosynthesis tyrosine autokinase [Acidobacteriota bacterium]